MFFNWKLHQSKWLLFGYQHPITGQSYVYPVLPSGFRLSPLIACTNTSLMASIIAEEAENRARGMPCREALKVVRELGIRHEMLTLPMGPHPSSTVYVDDYMGGAKAQMGCQELADIGSEVF